MPDIKIDDEVMRGIVQKAILDSLSSEQKELVIADALKYLITRTTAQRGYSTVTEPSPLEYAFREAVRGVALEVVREYLTLPDVRKIMHDKIKADLDALVDGENGWLHYTVGQAISSLVEAKLKEER